MSTSFSYTPDYLKREKLERRKQKLEEKLEDVRMALDAYSHKHMECVKKVNECQAMIPLAVHPLMRDKLNKKYEKLSEERDTAFAKSLECKATMDSLIYFIDQIDVEINGLEEEAVLSDD